MTRVPNSSIITRFGGTAVVGALPRVGSFVRSLPATPPSVGTRKVSEASWVREDLGRVC